MLGGNNVNFTDILQTLSDAVSMHIFVQASLEDYVQDFRKFTFWVAPFNGDFNYSWSLVVNIQMKSLFYLILSCYSSSYHDLFAFHCVEEGPSNSLPKGGNMEETGAMIGEDNAGGTGGIWRFRWNWLGGGLRFQFLPIVTLIFLYWLMLQAYLNQNGHLNQEYGVQ